MKKSILFLSVLAVMVSCKKDETTEFTPTDVTGTSVLKGNVNKNVITPNGTGGWNTNARIPAAGVNVSVKVNKNSLYPNSTAQGADVYTGTTDANGNYTISVKSNATGVAALVTIDGFTGTQDTIINGVTKTGLYSTYAGTTNNRTLFMGQNSQYDYQFTAGVVSTNPNTVLKIGTAVVTGSVGMNFVKEVLTGTVVSITTTMVPVPNHKVYLNFSNDPNTQATKAYEAVTDASGYYSFTLTTVAPGTTGFNQNASVYVPDFATTRDTLRPNNTIKTGRAGVYSGTTINQNGVYNNAIRNATHFSYSSFTQN